MKIRIKGKGLPKAQYQNSQPGKFITGVEDPNKNSMLWANFSQPLTRPINQQDEVSNNQSFLQLPSDFTWAWSNFNQMDPNILPKKNIIGTDGSNTITGGFGEPTNVFVTDNSPGKPVSNPSSIVPVKRLRNGKVVPISYDPMKNFKKTTDILKGGIALGSAVSDFFQNKQRTAGFNRYMRNQMSTDASNVVSDGSRGDYVVTGSRTGEFRPDDYIVNKGMYTAEDGGEINKFMKIRIKSVPQKLAYGGQSGYGLDLGSKRVDTDMNENLYESVSNTIGAVPREYANIEAEGGETIYGDLNNDGKKLHKKIVGPRHSEGGVPLNVPEGTFIFSDTQKMKIKDPEILSYFGMSEKKGGYTPAEIAKKYDVNKYMAILEDPNSDELDKNTAQLMVNNYNKKLAYLSMIQESMKGFPQGVPDVAKDEIDEEPEMKYGGYTDNLPIYQKKGQVTNTNRVAVWDEDEQKALQEYIKNKYNVEIPINARDIDPNSQRFTLPSMQPSRGGKRVYGDEDWTSAANMADFAKRQKNFLAKNPNWDPTKVGATEKFQRWYDAERVNKGLKPYFGKGQKFQEYDDKFGEYTFSAPDINPTTPPPPPSQPKVYQGFICKGTNANGLPIVETVTFNSEEEFKASGAYKSDKEATMNCGNPFVPKEFIPPTKPKEESAKYFLPDDWAVLNALAFPPKKRMPFIGQFNVEVPSPTFNDPNRELAANAELINMMSQGVSTFANPQAYMANMAAAQGKGAENAANILGKFNNFNVGIANQFSPMQSEIRNKKRMIDAERATQLYDKSVVGDQNYRNAVREYWTNIVDKASNRFNNRMYSDFVNKVNPFFNLNQRTGLSYFKNGFNPNMLGSGNSGGLASNTMSFRDLKNKFIQDGYSESFAERKADQLINGGRGITSYADNDMDGIPDRANYTGQMNNMMEMIANLRRFLPVPGNQ